MKAVINSTPLISLAIIDKIDILSELFKQIYIPQSVYNEVYVRGKGKSGSSPILSNNCFQIDATLNIALKQSIMLELDEGEAEVIAIAKEKDIETVIIDEFAGRKYAKLLGLNVIGTLGVLLLGKKQGLIKEIRPMMDILIDNKRYINKLLYETVLKNANEM